jgi:predicted transcriptional regulator
MEVIMPTEEMTRMSIDVPTDLHQMIKSIAAVERRTMRDLVVEAITTQLKEKVEAQQQAFASQYREVNDLTRLTLEKADRGKELHQYNSLDDFIAEMNAECASILFPGMVA